MKVSTRKNYFTILVTLLFVVFLGAVYFFVYIPNNEKRLQEQRFRTLHNINKNIHEKIRNSVALMNNLLKEEADIDYINYLSSQSKANFSLSLPVSTGAGEGTVITDSGYTLKASNESRQLTLLLYKLSVNAEGDTTASQQMAMKFSFEQFFKSLLPNYIFRDLWRC